MAGCRGACWAAGLLAFLLVGSARAER